MFLLFCREGSHHTGDLFFAVNRLPILYGKLIDVFVHTPAGHNPGLRSTVLHGNNFDFNSILIQVIRKPSLTSNTGPTFVFPRIHPFGVDLSSLRGDVYSRHDPAHLKPVKSMSRIVKECCPREISHRTSIFAGFTHSKCLLEDFRIFCCDAATSLLVLEHTSKVDSSRLTQHWVRFGTPIRHSSPQRVSPYWKRNVLKSAEQVLHTNPILLRRD